MTTPTEAREIATHWRDFANYAGDLDFSDDPELDRAEFNSVADALRSLADQVEALTVEKDKCGAGAGCLYKDALIEALTAERDALKDKYEDLIYQVSQKFKDETRHQTAKRYIASWEGRSAETSVAKGVAT